MLFERDEKKGFLRGLGAIFTKKFCKSDFKGIFFKKFLFSK